MYLSKTIPVKIYGTKLQFIVSSDIIKTHNKINEFHKTQVVWQPEEAPEGCTLLISTVKYYIIIDSKYLSYNTICHELYHCVCNMAADRGIHEEESRAWLQGILAQEIFCFLEAKKVKVKCNG